MGTIGKVIKTIYSIFMFFIAYIIVLFQKICKTNKKDTKIWLISELKNMARDNGIALYNYCMENKNEKNEIYYIMDKRNNDYKTIKYKKNIITFYSLKHYVYYLKADVLITCFADAICPSFLLEKFLNKYKIVKSKKVYLKHGIIKDYIKSLVYPNYKTDLLVTATEKEYNYIKSNYNHSPEVIQLLGLCRYDYLKDESDKKTIKILIMPTWRRWIKNNFQDTEFYQQYNNLIERLELEFKNKKDIKIYMYLHNNFQKYSKYFMQNENIKVLISQNCKVNELINKCNLLITDYSSVAFDFAYLNKPILYFHFDYEKVREKHYQQGYFEYERDGFGKIEYQIDNIIEDIKYIDKNQYKNQKKYEDRINECFKYRDNDNCKRTFEAIEKIVGGKKC